MGPPLAEVTLMQSPADGDSMWAGSTGNAGGDGKSWLRGSRQIELFDSYESFGGTVFCSGPSVHSRGCCEPFVREITRLEQGAPPGQRLPPAACGFPPFITAAGPSGLEASPRYPGAPATPAPRLRCQEPYQPPAL
ncbi:hypothetical protein CB1_000309008 [Camelus ferus]|nr:hypothetical protein CB1_000309008 [Camelus ferus]